jgi:type 1 glutamine amidotransferase
MCVLGRPFGLRQMAKNGKDVALMRDQTDTMYNPLRWPFVSHFTGTDLIVEHIEKFVCPTISSEQLLGGKPFRFAGDKRPHLVALIAEDEYKTEQTVPAFTAKNLGSDFRVSHVFGSAKERHDLPGYEIIADADVLLVSVRRRPLPAAQLDLVRKHVAAGKPIVGIRTASHAFAGRENQAPEGLAQWVEFDADVLGGHYTGHHGNNIKPAVTLSEAAASDDLLKNVGNDGFTSGGSLYKVSPLKPGARVLGMARIEGQPEEPVAWTFVRKDGGRTFYTSLGHVDDFQEPAFDKLLANGIYWAAGLPAPDKRPTGGPAPEKTK